MYFSVESVMEIVSKNSFLLCFPGAFPRLASAKVRTFLITQKPFPFFSYKKGNFFQIKEGTQYYIYTRAKGEKEKNPGDPRQVLWNACNAFACQLYVRKIYLQEALSGNEEGEN